MSAIGFTGYPGTGKDAIAQELVTNHGYERIAFGDAVKEMLLDIDPVFHGDLETLEYFKRRGHEHTREKLQNLGQRLRDIDKDFWVKRVEEIGIPMKAVFTDLRYYNELDFVQRNCGGRIYGIKRAGHGPVNDHESEKNTELLLDLADFTIYNNATIERAATEIMKHETNRI